MLTVIWGINGFHVVDLITEQHSYNTQYFLNHILESLLLAVFPEGRKPHSPRLSLAFNNCRVRCSKVFENFFAENYIIRVCYPPYSPDLAPSDFWLFGHMKTALAGQQFPGPEGVLTGVQAFLCEI
jgi:histone-lysine N-methyltransferase SETMAR